ncbi:MAG: flagellar hook-basal body protein [Chloroflexota bacterium]
MIRGAYTSISGMIAAQRRMDILGDNIANVNTTGFKQSFATQASLEMGVGLASGGGYAPLGSLGVGTYAAGLTIDQLQGPLQATGIPTDLGITGDGLFVVGTPTGPAYTRAGDFVLDAGGTLTTQAGEPVLDVTGRPIVVPGGASGLTVGQDGTIAATGQRIALVSVPASGLARMGGNLYAITGTVTPVAAGAGAINQGALEGSNVDLATSMTQMITAQREFQLSSRAYSLQDGTLQEANGIGRLK